MGVNGQSTATITGEDKEVLARTIFGEASGEPNAGKLAVGFVILNRARIALAYVRQHKKPHPLFGDGTIRSACTIGRGGIHQFSCWNVGKDRDRMLAANDATRGWAMCAATAGYVIDALSPALADRLKATGIENPIGWCTHYYNPKAMVPPNVPPSWAMGLTPFAVIGDHRFFDNVN